MRILFLNAYFQPETIAFSHLERDLIERLLAAGHELTVICPSPTRGVDAETVRAYRGRRDETLYDGRVRVHRIPMVREGRNPILRALRYFMVNAAEYVRGCRVRDADVIFAVSTPPTQGLLCGLVAGRLKIPFVYSLQDVFPDSLVSANMTQKGSLLWKIGRWVEDRTYRRADRIVAITEDFRRNILEKGVPDEKIVMIPNWIDAQTVHPVAREENILFSRYGLDPERYYLCYSGNIGYSQNLRLLLDAAKVLQTELPDVRFVLIGEGAAKDDLLSAVRREQIGNVILLPFQPYEDIAHVFSLGDAGLIISKPGVGSSSVPSKTWSIMSAARPILASFDEESDLSRLVREQQAGVVARSGDLPGLIAAVKQLYANPADAARMGWQGRRYVCEYLGRERCTALYEETLRGVVRERKA
ncbi:MAG: glycosyltransferase family 4 protein [Aristaeellaceae bacterium]